MFTQKGGLRSRLIHGVKGGPYTFLSILRREECSIMSRKSLKLYDELHGDKANISFFPPSFFCFPRTYQGWAFYLN